MALSKIRNDSLADTAVHGRRNMVINGSQIVSQRGTSFTSKTTSTYATDRMEVRMSNIGTYTITQETDAPDGSGLTKSLKIDCTTADSDGSDGAMNFAYHFEGQDLQHLEKGTSAAKKTTLSFWAKADAAGDIQVNLRDVDNTRHIGATVTLSTTWKHHVITFDGDTSGAFNNDANDSMWIEWWLGYGSSDSTYTGGSVPTTWAAESANNRAAGNTFNISSSTSKFFQITGIQYEVGDTATPFEHRSYGEELTLCQRYFHQVEHNFWFHPIDTSNTYRRTNIEYPATMRAVPTITIALNNDGSSKGIQYQSKNGFSYYVDGVSGDTRSNGTTQCDAEL